MSISKLDNGCRFFFFPFYPWKSVTHWDLLTVQADVFIPRELFHLLPESVWLPRWGIFSLLVTRLWYLVSIPVIARSSALDYCLRARGRSEKRGDRVLAWTFEISQWNGQMCNRCHIYLLLLFVFFLFFIFWWNAHPTLGLWSRGEWQLAQCQRRGRPQPEQSILNNTVPNWTARQSGNICLCLLCFWK